VFGSVRIPLEQISAVTDSVSEKWQADHTITTLLSCILNDVVATGPECSVMIKTSPSQTEINRIPRQFGRGALLLE